MAASEAHRFVVADQLEALGIPRGQIILEPIGRNTAAVALVASLLVAKHDRDGLILLLPSDHLVRNSKAFQRLIAQAAPAVRASWICLFGIAPDRPETGYGYIEIELEAVPDEGSPVRRVARFIEKPNAAAAERLLEVGNNVWNAGILLFSAATMLKEAEECRPELLAGVREAVAAATKDADFLRLGSEAFERVESISVDYAIIEDRDRTAVLRAEIDLSDLGGWDAIYGAHVPDGDGNVLLGRAVGQGTRNSLVRSDHHLVAAVGVDNLIVVATDDAVLVADKSQAQGVKAALRRDLIPRSA